MGPRLIPLEPMQIIFNLALSGSFSSIDWAQLAFPAQYKVEDVPGGGA